MKTKKICQKIYELIVRFPLQISTVKNENWNERTFCSAPVSLSYDVDHK